VQSKEESPLVVALSVR